MQRSALATLLFLVNAVALPAQRPWPDGNIRRGTLSFDGRSTLGDFTGTTQTVRGEMSGGATLADIRGWVEAPVNTLKTGNDRRDRDLVKTMEAEIFPLIRFELAAVAPEWQRGDSAGVTLRGNFVIHGVTRETSFPAAVFRGSEGIHLTATLPMDLHDYQVKNLTRFLVLKMQRDIVVHVDLLFQGAREPGS